VRVTAASAFLRALPMQIVRLREFLPRLTHDPEQ